MTHCMQPWRMAAWCAAVVSAVMTMPAVAQNNTAAPATDTSTSKPPTAEELYDQFVEAMGGKEAVDSITSVHSTVHLASTGRELLLETNWRRDGAFTIAYDMGGISNRAGSDGKTAWTFQSGSGFALVSEDRRPIVEERASLATMLLTLEDRYESMRYIGRDNFHDTPAYRVELTDHQGQIRLAFYDRESKLLLGLRWTEDTPMGAKDVEMTFHDWQQHGPIRTWTRLVLTRFVREQVFTVTSIEFNNVPDEAFALPDEVRELAAKQQDAKPAAPTTPAPTTPAPSTAPTPPAKPKNG